MYNQVVQEAEAAGSLKRQYSRRKDNLLLVVIVKHCSCVVFKIKKIVLGIICQTTKHILQTVAVLCCSTAARQGADSRGNRKCLVQKKKKEMLILFEDDSLN